MSFIETNNDNKPSAKIVGTILSWVGYAIAAWIVFKPTPYMFSIWVGILYPFFSIGVVAFYKGDIRLEEKIEKKKKKKKGNKSSIYLSIILICCALGLRGMYDFEIITFSKVILPVLLGVVIFSTAIYLALRSYQKPLKAYFGIIILCIFSTVWSYGGVMAFNFNYDPLTPRPYETKVLDKYIYTSKRSKTYYLTVAPWEKQAEEDKLSVSENKYEKTNIGDVVTVYYSEGLFGIPYFIVDGK